ncbi:MAG: lysylphosphatidylglycerol synthase transmembrane domain-containing protein [Bacteroidota bacterium]
MKKTLIQAAKIIIPVALAIYLSWYFIASMGEEEKQKVSSVFSEANYFIIFLSIVFAWISHVLRAARWNLLLEPMGYKPSFWNNYHAVMIGYFMNLLLPRAGELSRAGIISKTDNVPFEKGFGTIVAERVIDTLVLGCIVLVTMLLQYDKFMEMMSQLGNLNGEKSGNNITLYIGIGIAVAGIVALVIYLKNERFRNKIKQLVRGFIEGILTIVRMKKFVPFFLYTIGIWFFYVTLYLVCFYALESTAGIPVKILMLGFIGGAIGIILVQGGIGVYPLLIATAISIYKEELHNDQLFPILIGLGWVMWLAQTFLLVAGGAVSFYLVSKKAIKE